MVLRFLAIAVLLLAAHISGGNNADFGISLLPIHTSHGTLGVLDDVGHRSRPVCAYGQQALGLP